MSEPTHQLSNLQLELLKLYPYSVSDQEIKEIRQLLAEYFSKKIDQEIDQLWVENNWTPETLEHWKNEHLRSIS